MIVTGEHTGDFFGIPPKGNNFSYQAAHISRIADDKLVENKGDSMKYGGSWFEDILKIRMISGKRI